MELYTLLDIQHLEDSVQQNLLITSALSLCSLLSYSEPRKNAQLDLIFFNTDIPFIQLNAFKLRKMLVFVLLLIVIL